MKTHWRVVVALAILLSGVAVIPVLSFAWKDGFHWQRYANVYQEPQLNINYTTGKPGSAFALTGDFFPANTVITIFINNQQLGTIQTGNSGNFYVVLTTQQADVGYYTIATSFNKGLKTSFNTGPKVTFVLNENEPLRPLPNPGPTFQVPAGIAYHTIFLPMVLQH